MTLLAELAVLSLAATGLALILRKLLTGKIRGFFAEALQCDVCSGFWASLLVDLIRWNRWTVRPHLPSVSEIAILALTLLASTAVVAILLRIYNRIDPGPVLWLEEQDETDRTERTH